MAHWFACFCRADFVVEVQRTRVPLACQCIEVAGYALCQTFQDEELLGKAAEVNRVPTDRVLQYALLLFRRPHRDLDSHLR